MRIHFIVSLVAVAMLSLLPKAAGQSAVAKAGIGRTLDGKPDISGVWVNDSFKTAPGGGLVRFDKNDLPFRPGGPQLWELKLTGDPHHDNPNFLSPVDKQYNFGCKPWGFPQVSLTANAQQFFQSPGFLVIVYEGTHATRMIPMDGRAHPEDPDPAYLGNSVGKYEGDTAVIDTTALRAGGSDGAGHHLHTEAAHYIERYRRTGPTTLSFELTTDDPKIFTKPWTSGPWTLHLHPEWVVLEGVCEDSSPDAKLLDYLHHAK